MGVCSVESMTIPWKVTVWRFTGAAATVSAHADSSRKEKRCFIGWICTKVNKQGRFHSTLIQEAPLDGIRLRPCRSTSRSKALAMPVMSGQRPSVPSQPAPQTVSRTVGTTDIHTFPPFAQPNDPRGGCGWHTKYTRPPHTPPLHDDGRPEAVASGKIYPTATGRKTDAYVAYRLQRYKLWL